MAEPLYLDKINDLKDFAKTVELILNTTNIKADIAGAGLPSTGIGSNDEGPTLQNGFEGRRRTMDQRAAALVDLYGIVLANTSKIIQIYQRADATAEEQVKAAKDQMLNAVQGRINKIYETTGAASAFPVNNTPASPGVM